MRFKATIHFDTNAHLVFEGEYRKSLEDIKNMIVEEVLCMPNATPFAISLVVSKTFLSCHLFNDYGEGPIEFFKGDKLNQTMLKFNPMRSPNIYNRISLFKPMEHGFHWIHPYTQGPYSLQLHLG
jgi:hypothetical protein